MPKTVLIILAAVVVLIVIVVRAGMRYLRADDDDFDDGAPAEHGRLRSRGTYPTGDQQARRRAHHGEEMPHERRTERVGAARGTRSSAGYGGERGPDRRGDVRSGQDQGWRDDSGEIPPSGERSREPVRPRQERLVRSGPGGHPEISEPVAAGARSGRSKPGRGASLELDEFDSQPGRAGASNRIYERDAAGGRDRRDDRDRFGREEADIAGRRESRNSRDGRAGRDGRDSREPRDSRDSSDRIRARPAESDRELGDYDGRDRGATRPNARPDARKNGARTDRGELLPAVKPRQGKGKRDNDGDWPTNEWDELSDVDYWAELASDKPLTTAGPSAHGSRTQGRESRQEGRPGANRHQRADADSDSAVRQANRRERKPDQAVLPPLARKPEVAAPDRPAALDRFAAVDRPEPTDRFGAADPRAAGARPIAAGHAAPRPAAAMPAPADDDPLTSPSFPRIAADDSRSYRRTRAAATSDGRQSASVEPDIVQPTRNGGRAAARHAEPHQAYPAVPRVESVSGLEAASQTGTYPAGYQLPAANVAGYAQATGGYGSPDSGTASYPAGSSYQEPGNYPPGPSAGAGSYGSDPAARGSYPGSEVPGYHAESGSGAYLAAVPDGYPAALSSPSYEGGGSYSLPAHTSGYDIGYPDQAAGYQGYTESSTSSGAHLRPEPGYQAGSYPGHAEPSFGASLAGGHGDLSYPAYPTPMAADHGAAYQAPAPQLPGYQDAPYPAGPHDPAGYPASVRETGGYGDADPYAVDPYGQPGYGGSGY